MRGGKMEGKKNKLPRPKLRGIKNKLHQSQSYDD